MHATPDFLCSCDCCGEGCGEIKCPLCLENCDFDAYVLKPSSCLVKNSAGEFILLTTHEYYYQVQQQLFTTKLNYCYFVVCAVYSNELKLVSQRILPDKAHWSTVVPKLQKFWRICVLPEVLARWYTRRENRTEEGAPLANSVCYCRQETEEDTVKCCNPHCPIQQFHLSCLGIDAISKTWYCPKCRALPEFKRGGSKQQSASVISEAMKMNSICTCKAVAEKKDKLVKCSNTSCTNGKFFHLSCLGRKRMPNNSKSWLCPVCMISNAQEAKNGTASKPPVTHVTTKPTVTHVTTNTKPTVSSGTEEVTIVKTVFKNAPPRDNYGPEGKLGQYEYSLISSPNGWLDCVIIHEAHILLNRISAGIQGFQRPTLGSVRQFDIMTGPFIHPY